MKRAITMVVAAALFASLLFAGSAVAQVDQNQAVENDADQDATINNDLTQSNSNSQSASGGIVGQSQSVDQTNVGVQTGEIDQEVEQEIDDLNMGQFGLDLL